MDGRLDRAGHALDPIDVQERWTFDVCDGGSAVDGFKRRLVSQIGLDFGGNVEMEPLDVGDRKLGAFSLGALAGHARGTRLWV